MSIAKEILNVVTIPLVILGCVLYVLGILKASKSRMNREQWEALNDCQFSSCKLLGKLTLTCIIVVTICFSSIMILTFFDFIFGYSWNRSFLSDFLSYACMCAFDLSIVASILNGLIHRFRHQRATEAG